MSDTTQLDAPKRVSRRTVVKGGLAVGGALWAAPAVEVLTASKAFAATASGTTGGISYVMLVLRTAAGAIITAKVDQDGSLSCPGSPSSDQGTRWSTWLSTNFSGATTAGCPSDLSVVGVTANTTTVNLGGSTLIGFMVHDGSLGNTVGKVGFSLGTTLPANSAYLPSTWGSPSVTATGTVTFTKP